MKPEKIELMPFGFSVSFKLKLEDYNKKILKANLLEKKKIIVALAGPLTNLFIVVILIFTNINIESKDIILYSNILIVLFNLLPIYPLDGGRILSGILHMILGGKRSKQITNKTANVTMVIITIISSIGIFYFKNIAIFLIIIFLWGLVIRENRKYKIIIKAYNIMDKETKQ